MTCTVVPHATQSVQHATDTQAALVPRPNVEASESVRNEPICPHGTMPCHRSQAGAGGAGGRVSESANAFSPRERTNVGTDLHDREEQVDDERMPDRHVQAAEAHRRHLRRRRLHDDE